MIIDCIAKPYDNFGKSSLGKDAEPVYDCFGNCYEKLDDFHRYSMTLINPDPNKEPAVVTSTTLADPVKKCFSEENLFSESFQPLEICGIPFSHVKTVMNYRYIFSVTQVNINRR